MKYTERQEKIYSRNEYVCARPNGRRESVKLRFRVGDLDLPERRKGYTSSRGEEESRCTDVPVWQSDRV